MGAVTLAHQNRQRISNASVLSEPDWVLYSFNCRLIDAQLSAEHQSRDPWRGGEVSEESH